MRALITGISGMDGSHLAEILVEMGHDVFGMIRDPDRPTPNLSDELRADVRFVTADLLDVESLRRALRQVVPDVIYHLAAMSSPSQAWLQPELCAQITGVAVGRLLDLVNAESPDSRVIVAGSIAEHGPYGAAKTYAQLIAAEHRTRGLSVTTVVMGGHHSPRRGASYLSKKVANHVRRVADSGERAGKLQLGWLGRYQDWGWAPDFMQTWAQARRLPPGEYVLSTGDSHRVEEYVALAYESADLDWRDWVTLNGAAQPTDVSRLSAAPDPRLLFRSTVDFPELVDRMVNQREF